MAIINKSDAIPVKTTVRYEKPSFNLLDLKKEEGFFWKRFKKDYLETQKKADWKK